VARLVDYASAGVPLAFYFLYLMCMKPPKRSEPKRADFSGLMFLQSVFRNGVAQLGRVGVARTLAYGLSPCETPHLSARMGFALPICALKIPKKRKLSIRLKELFEPSPKLFSAILLFRPCVKDVEGGNFVCPVDRPAKQVKGSVSVT
jgi:hypothetical protein